MATYASLTPVEKATVNELSKLIRSGAGEVAKVFNHLATISQDVDGIALVQSIDAGDDIPDGNGLAGAAALTRAELSTLYTLLNGIRTVNDTTAFRTQATAAAGVNALQGA